MLKYNFFIFVGIIIVSDTMTYCESYHMTTVLLVILAKVHVVHSGLRIIGGRESLPEEFPYVVKLDAVLVNASRPSITFCSASVLSATWSLTAAHCIRFLDRFSVNHPGIEHKHMIRTEPNEALFAVLSMYKHPRFTGLLEGDFVFIENDVGMLKTEPVLLKQYAKVSAVDYSAVKGQAARAVGYGLNVVRGKLGDMKKRPALPRPLNVLDLMVVECSIQWHLYPSICVAQRCGRSTTMCAGDSGAPLIHPSGIIAITSVYISKDCRVGGKNRSRTVGILTAVSPYISWITSQVIRDQ